MIERTIEGRFRDLGGGFGVRRILPAAGRRMVGPFIFFDHMGPADYAPGQRFDVRPHPHINLATVTYLFEGQIFHRDSLGYAQAIEPGAVNWMIAGSGITHSERTSPEVEARGQRLHGIQAWAALPKSHEEVAPSFTHHPAGSLPVDERHGVRLTLIAGTAFGMESPVDVFWPTFYLDAEAPRGATVQVPDEHEERALYIAIGEVEVAGARHGAGSMLVLEPGPAEWRAATDARVLMIGGARMDGPRHIWWNFVSSRPERIHQAMRDWDEHRFATIPGDDQERIPLPDEPAPPAEPMS